MRIKEENYITQLKCRNKRALKYVIKKYGCMIKGIISMKLYRVQSFQEDCMCDVLMGVWKHIDCFDESKNTFQNWVAAITRFQCIKYLTIHLCEVRHFSWEKVVVKEEDYAYELLLEQEISSEIQEMSSCLDEKEKQLFHKLYMEQRDMGQVLQGDQKVIYTRMSWGKARICKLLLQRGREKRGNG